MVFFFCVSISKSINYYKILQNKIASEIKIFSFLLLLNPFVMKKEIIYSTTFVVKSKMRPTSYVVAYTTDLLENVISNFVPIAAINNK